MSLSRAGVAGATVATTAMLVLSLAAPSARAQAGAPAAAPVAAPGSAPASGALISGYGVTGQLVDPADQLQALLESVAPTGSPFIESGPADRIGTPIGTIPRLTQALDGIGYRAQVRAMPDAKASAGARVQIAIELHAYDRLRYIFVTGNWPIRQDEIQRRIALRPGSPLPPPGPERDATLSGLAQGTWRRVTTTEPAGYQEAQENLAGPEGHLHLPARSLTTLVRD